MDTHVLQVFYGVIPPGTQSATLRTGRRRPSGYQAAEKRGFAQRTGEREVRTEVPGRTSG
jgi:hypothetical protein